MELQSDPLKEVLGELFALLEAQETQSAAVLQFLKDQGIATEEKLAPYLEQAGMAAMSNGEPRAKGWSTC